MATLPDLPSTTRFDQHAWSQWFSQVGKLVGAEPTLIALAHIPPAPETSPFLKSDRIEISWEWLLWLMATRRAVNVLLFQSAACLAVPTVARFRFVPPPPEASKFLDSGRRLVSWHWLKWLEAFKASVDVVLTEGADCLASSTCTPCIHVGTLFPNEKPGGLGAGDYDQVFFYATDFDHWFRWTAPGVWRASDWSGRSIVMFTEAPTTPGWQLCDGSTNVRASKPDGTTEIIDAPLLNDNVFLMGAAAFSGNAPVAAVAPTLAGATAAVSAGTPAGSISSDGAHDHGAATATDGQHQHHVLAFGNTTENGSHTHTVPSQSVEGSGDTGFALSCIGVQAPLEGSPVDVAECQHQHEVTITGVTSGGETGEDGEHAHDVAVGGTAAGNDEGVDSAHSHAISSGGAHSHTFTGSALGTHSHGVGSLVVTDTALPKRAGVLPYIRL